jgi:hypothetical protein
VSLLESVAALLEERGTKYSRHDALPILKLDQEGVTGDWTVFVRAREEERQLIVLSVYPENVPDELLPAMAEFVTRANYGLNIGNFEMDYDDGEVRFRTSIDLEDAPLLDSLTSTLISANVAVMDDYFAGITAVLHGVPPASAVADCEA